MFLRNPKCCVVSMFERDAQAARSRALGAFRLRPRCGSSPGRSRCVTCQPGDTVIDVVDYAFQNGTQTVPLGPTVCWRNMGAVTHTVTSDSPGFNSGSLASDDSFRFTFPMTNKTYAYHCNIHSTMKGSIRVSG